MVNILCWALMLAVAWTFGWTVTGIFGWWGIPLAITGGGLIGYLSARAGFVTLG